jgi:acetyl esterase/lipase
MAGQTKLTKHMKNYDKMIGRRTIWLVIKFCLARRVSLLKLLNIQRRLLAATKRAYKSGATSLDAIDGNVSPQEASLVISLFRPVFELTTAQETKRYLKTRPGARNVTFEPVMTGRMRAYWITPPNASTERTFFYIHGGGWSIGSAEAVRIFCTEIAMTAGIRVLSVDYRLYPEHPHPAQIDDVFEAYEWLVNSGTSPENIVIGGESAGGHLSLLLLNRLKVAGLPVPAGAVLISPPFDLLLSGQEAFANIPTDPTVNGGGGVLGINLLHHAGTDSDPSFIPITFDLAGFPPILLIASATECLYYDAVKLNDKANSAGISIEFQAWEGALHAFPVTTRMDFKETKEANSKIIDFINSKLSLQ